MRRFSRTNHNACHAALRQSLKLFPERFLLKMQREASPGVRRGDHELFSSHAYRGRVGRYLTPHQLRPSATDRLQELVLPFNLFEHARKHGMNAL